MADGMYSNEEEYVEFVEPVLLEGQVEYWLRDIGEFIYFFFFKYFTRNEDRYFIRYLQKECKNLKKLTRNHHDNNPKIRRFFMINA